jgi:hypothetical protein
VSELTLGHHEHQRTWSGAPALGAASTFRDPGLAYKDRRRSGLAPSMQTLRWSGAGLETSPLIARHRLALLAIRDRLLQQGRGVANWRATRMARATFNATIFAMPELPDANDHGVRPAIHCESRRHRLI